MVLASKYRKALVMPHVAQFSPMLFNEDIDPPAGWYPKPEYVPLSHNMRRTYRIFRAHQEAWRRLSRPIGLILEDDAVPNRSDWVEIVNFAIEVLASHEMVVLHSRCYNLQEFKASHVQQLGIALLAPAEANVLMVGSLAYMMSKETAARLINYPFDGIPSGLYLFRSFEFVVIDPSPFNHDRSEGSMMDNGDRWE